MFIFRRIKLIINKLAGSLSAKIILLTSLLVVGILVVQTFIYVRVETKNLENIQIENKKNFAELLSINFSAAQSVGGFAFETQLIDNAGRTSDTVFVRFVRPDGVIYLSSLEKERGSKIENSDNYSDETIIKDLVYEGKTIKLIIAPGSGGYATWLGFSFDSIQSVINSTVLSRMLIASFILIIGILFSLLLSYRLTRNLRSLKELAEEVGKGNFTVKAKIISKDELGNLAKSFNIMIDELAKSCENVHARVKELAREHGKLSSLVESVKLGVVMVDLRLNVILANSSARVIFGRPRAKSLLFSDLAEKIKGSVNISQTLSYYVHSGKPLNIQEVIIGENYYRLFMSPVRDIVEKIFIGAVIVIEDITEQKKLDKMRTEIVSVTSHQLRTPATIVKGNLEMILGGDVGKVPKEQKELLDDTYMGNERMIHLINDLMDAAKINEGKLSFPLEPAQLEDIIEEVVKENKPFAEKKRVVLSFVRPKNLLPKVKINVQKVKQVFQNLIDNAIKYSAVGDKGKVMVTVEDDDQNIRFIVKDNGIGIPRSEQSKIFARFSRGSNSTQLDPGGGSGLGLYIAKAVIEQGGGKIWFESEEGVGTTFFVTFPLS